MMRLFIDERPYEADLSGVSLPKYNHDNLAKIDSSREGHHIRLKIPSTPESDRLFCNAADMQSAERFNESLHSARIEADGAEMFVGTAYFDGVEVIDGVVFYRLEIVGGATQWAEQAGRQMFNLIGLDYSAMLNMSEICNSWSSDSPVKFLPVQHPDDELHNGQTTSATPETILTSDNYHPFISVEALCRRIFEAAGYKIESRFFESEEFRSLYISGAYSLTDLDSKMEKMEFYAGRTTRVTAEANSAGRVYVSPAVAANSLGNIVDTFTPEIIGEGGQVVPTDYFSKSGCFAMDDDGAIVFRPISNVNVGFEFVLKFACDYRIESREHLHSFDMLYLGNGVSFPFKLTNRFKDCRGRLYRNFKYRFVNFGYSPEYNYRLSYRVGREWVDWAEIGSNTTLILSPQDIESAKEVALFRAAKGSAVYDLCSEDWALYEGHVNFEGSTEVELTLRTPAEEMTASSTRYFDTIYFEGADPGMSLTLLPGTTLRPIFTSAIGYGSHITFEDIAQLRVRQATLLDAVRQMFNLRFYTDEHQKVVYIEPYNDFVLRGECFEWSDRIDFSQPILIEDLAREIHERRVVGYQDGDEAVRHYNSEYDTELGQWVFDTSLWGTIQGEQQLRNPFFQPTLSLSGGYANAESAQVMQMGSEEELAESGNQLARIVRFVGMHPLPDSERWGYPYSGQDYPLAAFHFAGDEYRDGFSLCFEDRDGCEGLHTYYDRQFAEEAKGRKVSLSMQIYPDEYTNLFRMVDGAPSIRSAFALKINGVEQQYRLHSIESYDAERAIAKCVFTQITPRYE